MVCAKKADSRMKHSWEMGLGGGLDLNSKGRYIGHLMCNTANPLGSNQSYAGFRQLCAGPSLGLASTHAQARSTGKLIPQDNP